MREIPQPDEFQVRGRDLAVEWAIEAIESYEHNPDLPSWVYFAGERELKPGCLVKIGVSTNPPKRMQSLKRQTGFLPIIFGTIPGAYRLEMILHDAYFYLKDHLEWYVADSHLISFFEDYAERQNKKEAA